MLRRIEWGQVCVARLGKEKVRTAHTIRDTRANEEDLVGWKDFSFFLCAKCKVPRALF